MPPPNSIEILDIEAVWDSQDLVRVVNIAATAQESAAYWRGRCDGMAETVAYLKDRLNKAESLLFNPKPIVIPVVGENYTQDARD